jgi:hypothetical protein
LVLPVSTKMWAIRFFLICIRNQVFVLPCPMRPAPEL